MYLLCTGSLSARLAVIWCTVWALYPPIADLIGHHGRLAILLRTQLASVLLKELHVAMGENVMGPKCRLAGR